jgi:hypothetical protein
MVYFDMQAEWGGFAASRYASPWMLMALRRGRYQDMPRHDPPLKITVCHLANKT